MNYYLKRSVKLRWLFDLVLHSSLDDLVDRNVISNLSHSLVLLVKLDRTGPPHNTTLILMFYWFCWNCLSQSTRSDDIHKYWHSEKLTQANREGVDGVGIGAVWGLRLRLSAARKGVLSSLIFLKSPLGHCVNTILGRKSQNREPHKIVQDVVHIQINDKTHTA